MDRRTLWISQTRHYKSKILERLVPILNSEFIVNGSAGLISTEEEYPSGETLVNFNGLVPIQWRVMGGYVYELIFAIKSNNLFTETADVDIGVHVKDMFSTNDTVMINCATYGTSSFFEDFLEKFIQKMKLIDFSDIESELDELPKTHEENGIIHDFGKLRFFISSPISTQTLCQRKIQIYLSRGGVYDEIFDIIFYTELLSDKTLIYEVFDLRTENGITKVNCCDLLRLVCGDLEALGERIAKPSEKSNNHIGRIMYIFQKFNLMTEEEQRYIISAVSLFCARLSRITKLKGLELGKYEFVYRTKMISISEFLEPLKFAANKFNTPYFIHMFGNN